MNNAFYIDCCGCEEFYFLNDNPHCFKQDRDVDYYGFCKDYTEDEFNKDVITEIK